MTEPGSDHKAENEAAPEHEAPSVMGCVIASAETGKPCGRTPAAPMSDAEGGWITAPMCAWHQKAFRKSIPKIRKVLDGLKAYDEQGDEWGE